MTAPEQPKTEDIKQSLEQLGTETTAADLVRAKGQTRKVRVIHEKQLMEWILRLLQQHLAGKADAFSDAEKEELLKKAQEELARRIKREQELASERDKAKLAMGDLMERMSQAQATQADRDTFLAELKAQLEEREQVIQDLQNDADDLRDQLSEKVALLSTTLAEKDKLRLTVRNQMIRSGSLVEGVLGLDSTYYSSRHQNDNPVPDDAGEEEQFYHDFDVGASVVTTLSNDLERLRTIAQAAGDRPDEQEPQDAGLLERNLALLEQLKSGSLHAMDVADPVAGLVEALDGARAEAEAFNSTMSGALGHAAGQGIELSELPDASGDPAEVLAAATTVTRELAAELARGRTRLQALKSMADEADEARQSSEEETEHAVAACNTLLVSIAAQAESVGVDTPHLLSNAAAPLAERMPVAESIIQRLRDTEHREIERLTAALNAVSTERDALTVRITNVETQSKQLETQTERLANLAKDAEREKLQLAERLATDQIKLEADSHEIERLTSLVANLTAERDGMAARINNVESQTARLTKVTKAAEQEKQQLFERLEHLEQELAITKAQLQETEQRAEAAGAAQRALAAVLLSDASVANQTPADPVAQAASLNEAARNLSDTCEALTNRVQYQEKTIDELREQATLAEQRLTEANTERDEMAQSGKEIINQLTQQRDARAQEVEALRREHSALTGRVTELESRAQSAEAATRTLSESLAEIAASMAGDASIASGRAELESALAQLPESDEHEVVVPAELGRELATNGRKLASALKENLHQLNETKKTAEALTTQLATVNAQLIDREQALATQTSQLEQVKHTHAQALAQASAIQQQHVAVVTELSQVSERLRQAEAETADQRARGATSQDLAHADYQKALQDLDQAHAHIDSLEEQIAELSTQVAAAESRLVAQREDLAKRLAERDSVIQHKDRIIDQQAAQRADSKAQDAQITALRQELTAAAARVAELEARTHVVQAETVRSDDLGRELLGLQGERDQLREQLRRIESDLAEERSLRTQVESQLAERTKDIAASRSRIASEMVEVRERSRALIEENRRLREDVAGLQARLKRLLDGGKPSPSGAHQILPAK